MFMNDEELQAALDAGNRDLPKGADSLAYRRVFQSLGHVEPGLSPDFAARVASKAFIVRSRGTSLTLLVSLVVTISALVAGVGSVEVLALAGYLAEFNLDWTAALSKMPATLGYGVVSLVLLAVIDLLINRRGIARYNNA